MMVICVPGQARRTAPQWPATVVCSLHAGAAARSGRGAAGLRRQGTQAARAFKWGSASGLRNYHGVELLPLPGQLEDAHDAKGAQHGQVGATAIGAASSDANVHETEYDHNRVEAIHLVAKVEVRPVAEQLKHELSSKIGGERQVAALKCRRQVRVDAVLIAGHNHLAKQRSGPSLPARQCPIESCARR